MREWLAWARGLRTQGCLLVGVLATHHHPDHVGGLEVLTRELDIDLWAHAKTAALVGWNRYRSIADHEEFVLAGPEPTHVRALHTPGHAPGHVCLHIEALGLVLCGDMMAGVGSILIAPGDGDMIEYLAQLKRLALLGAHTALPAHGDPIELAEERYLALIAHRLRREARILACVPRADSAVGQVAGITSDELVQVAYADTLPDLWPVAELSLRSHLIKLVREGRVSQTGERYCHSGGVVAA